ncbi:MAG: hypothetical protein IT509_11515, partial [Rhodocyclaceae bacterium]|nr:hypothetical protein [Rhodocyclaceae bacterium]
KGVSGNLGATHLFALAAKLEGLAKTKDDPDAMAAAIERLAEASEQLARRLDALPGIG